ncbi:MAG: hypothetical protein AAFY71_21655 [Bacteroidota bacterium]
MNKKTFRIIILCTLIGILSNTYTYAQQIELAFEMQYEKHQPRMITDFTSENINKKIKEHIHTFWGKSTGTIPFSNSSGDVVSVQETGTALKQDGQLIPDFYFRIAPNKSFKFAGYGWIHLLPILREDPEAYKVFQQGKAALKSKERLRTIAFFSYATVFFPLWLNFDRVSKGTWERKNLNPIFISVGTGLTFQILSHTMRKEHNRLLVKSVEVYNLNQAQSYLPSNEGFEWDLNLCVNQQGLGIQFSF